jgi:tetrahydromethanopterin S-methyltransferase subunit B
MDSHEGWGTTDDPGTTGVRAVDEVLEELVVVDNAPVAEHVAIFERAHERLRRALDSSPEG